MEWQVSNNYLPESTLDLLYEYEESRNNYPTYIMHRSFDHSTDIPIHQISAKNLIFTRKTYSLLHRPFTR